ncbi:MAG TPA: hypothetical protein VF395_04255 [Polyangiaceae bacterium]
MPVPSPRVERVNVSAIHADELRVITPGVVHVLQTEERLTRKEKFVCKLGFVPDDGLEQVTSALRQIVAREGRHRCIL